GSDGHMYDTRRVKWAEEPFRKAFKYHFSEICNTKQFKSSLRSGQYAWPGGYRLAFSVQDGGVLCFDCATREAREIIDSIRNDYRDGWRVDGLFNVDHCEETVCCDHC